MARQRTKVLICTANKNNGKEISSNLKKIKSLVAEIKVENDPHKIPFLFQNDGSDLLILDQSSFKKETVALHDLLLQKDLNFPCLIIADRNIEEFSKEIDTKDLISILPFDWLDSWLLAMSIQKLLVRGNKSRMQKADRHRMPGLAILREGTFIEVNDHLCSLLGYKRFEILGQDLQILSSHKNDFLFLEKESNDDQDESENSSIYTTLQRKDGKSIDVLVLISRFIKNSEQYISLTIIDVSGHKEWKYQFQENEEKINFIAKHIGEGVFWVDENGFIVHWDNAMEKLVSVSCKEAIGTPLSVLLDRLDKQSVVKVDAAAVKEILLKVLSNNFPVRLNRVWEGEILNAQGEYRIFQADSFTMNSLQGNHMVVIMRDINDRRKHEKELQFLVDLASTIRQTPNNVTKVRQSACKLLSNLLYLDGIVIAGFKDNDDVGSIVETYGNLEIKKGTPVSWKSCFSQKTLYQNSIFNISEEYLEQLDGSFQLSLFPQVRIGMPLINGYEHVGLIFLFRSVPFSQYDYCLLDAVAHVLANALNQAIMFERTELRLKRMESLHVVDRAISGLFNLDLTNRIILEQAKQLLEVDGGDILILNTATNTMEYSAAFGINQLDVAEKRVHLSRSMAGQILLTREPCIFPDVGKGELPFIMKHLNRNGFQSYFGFPLIAKGELKGVFEVYKYDPFQPDAEWVNFLQALSTQASIAIDNIQLFESRHNF